MPNKFDPRQPHDLWLDAVDHVPEEERPVLTFRRVAGAEYVQIADAYEMAFGKTADGPDKTVAMVGAQIYRALSIGLIGSRNQVDLMTGETLEVKTADDLARVLNQVEAMSLLDKRLESSRLGGKERKNSESQSCSSLDGCAGTANQTNA